MRQTEPAGEQLRILVGLGNPGIEYAFTPHNFGYLLIDEVANRSGARVSLRECQSLTGRTRIAGSPVVLAKPETYMNLSGVAVRELLRKYERTTADLIVAYDDLDLPLGTIRIRERGSPGTHNGMRSVSGTLGTNEFVRVRLGVWPGHPLANAKGFLLSSWKKSQLATVNGVVERAADAVEMMLKDGVPKAMSTFNAPPNVEQGPKQTP